MSAVVLYVWCVVCIRGRHRQEEHGVEDTSAVRESEKERHTERKRVISSRASIVGKKERQRKYNIYSIRGIAACTIIGIDKERKYQLCTALLISTSSQMLQPEMKYKEGVRMKRTTSEDGE